MTNVTGNRFERATDDEIEQFAAHQLSSNTKKSTKSSITLLERYKVEAFGWTGSFVDLEEEDLVRLLQSFFQKIRKEMVKLMNQDHLTQCTYYGILRHFHEELKIELQLPSARVITKHLKIMKIQIL